MNPATQCINETVLYIASGCLALHSVLLENIDVIAEHELNLNM